MTNDPCAAHFGPARRIKSLAIWAICFGIAQTAQTANADHLPGQLPKLPMADRLPKLPMADRLPKLPMAARTWLAGWLAGWRAGGAGAGGRAGPRRSSVTKGLHKLFFYFKKQL
jgi:hypothetical protein